MSSMLCVQPADVGETEWPHIHPVENSHNEIVHCKIWQNRSLKLDAFSSVAGKVQLLYFLGNLCLPSLYGTFLCFLRAHLVCMYGCILRSISMIEIE